MPTIFDDEYLSSYNSPDVPTPSVDEVIGSEAFSSLPDTESRTGVLTAWRSRMAGDIDIAAQRGEIKPEEYDGYQTRLRDTYENRLIGLGDTKLRDDVLNSQFNRRGQAERDAANKPPSSIFGEIGQQAQSFAAATMAGTASGVTGITDAIAVGYSLATGEDPTENDLYQWGNNTQQFWEQLKPERLADGWAAKTGGAVGSGLSFIGLAALTGGVGKGFGIAGNALRAQQVTAATAAAAAKAAAAKAAATTAAQAAASTGGNILTRGGKYVIKSIAENPAISLLGGAMNAGGSYREARDMGYAENEALVRMGVGFGLGLTESIGLGTQLTRIDKITGGKFKNLLLWYGREALEEGAQEAGQTLAQGSFDLLYANDKNKAEFGEVLKNALEGGTFAALSAVLLGTVGGVQNYNARLQYKSDIDALTKHTIENPTGANAVLDNLQTESEKLREKGYTEEANLLDANAATIQKETFGAANSDTLGAEAAKLAQDSPVDPNDTSPNAPVVLNTALPNSAQAKQDAQAAVSASDQVLAVSDDLDKALSASSAINELNTPAVVVPPVTEPPQKSAADTWLDIQAEKEAAMAPVVILDSPDRKIYEIKSSGPVTGVRARFDVMLDGNGVWRPTPGVGFEIFDKDLRGKGLGEKFVRGFSQSVGPIGSTGLSEDEGTSKDAQKMWARIGAPVEDLPDTDEAVGSKRAFVLRAAAPAATAATPAATAATPAATAATPAATAATPAAAPAATATKTPVADAAFDTVTKNLEQNVAEMKAMGDVKATASMQKMLDDHLASKGAGTAVVPAAKSEISDRAAKLSDFSNPNEFYRVVVGEEAFQDIVDSGKVRTNANEKTAGKKLSLTERLAARPTAFPSFSKGNVSISYARKNPNHYVVVTSDSSIQPSKSGRHGKGSTMFPTDAQGNPAYALSGEAVRVYRHDGNGNYSLVYENGAVVNDSTTTVPTEQSTVPTEQPAAKSKIADSAPVAAKVSEPAAAPALKEVKVSEPAAAPALKEVKVSEPAAVENAATPTELTVDQRTKVNDMRRWAKNNLGNKNEAKVREFIAYNRKRAKEEPEKTLIANAFAEAAEAELKKYETKKDEDDAARAEALAARAAKTPKGKAKKIVDPVDEGEGTSVSEVTKQRRTLKAALAVALDRDLTDAEHNKANNLIARATVDKRSDLDQQDQYSQAILKATKFAEQNKHFDATVNVKVLLGGQAVKAVNKSVKRAELAEAAGGDEVIADATSGRSQDGRKVVEEDMILMLEKAQANFLIDNNELLTELRSNNPEFVNEPDDVALTAALLYHMTLTEGVTKINELNADKVQVVKQTVASIYGVSTRSVQNSKYEKLISNRTLQGLANSFIDSANRLRDAYRNAAEAPKAGRAVATTNLESAAAVAERRSAGRTRDTGGTEQLAAGARDNRGGPKGSSARSERGRGPLPQNVDDENVSGQRSGVRQGKPPTKPRQNGWLYRIFGGKDAALTHWGPDGITNTDPAKQGRGLAGAEAERREEFDKLYVPRTYFGLPGYRQEGGLPSSTYKAAIPIDQLYDIEADVDNLNPTMGSNGDLQKLGYAPFDKGAALTIYESRIKKAGYKGYVSRPHKVAVVFTKLDVTKVRDSVRASRSELSVSASAAEEAAFSNVETQQAKSEAQATLDAGEPVDEMVKNLPTFLQGQWNETVASFGADSKSGTVTALDALHNLGRTGPAAQRALSEALAKYNARQLKGVPVQVKASMGGPDGEVDLTGLPLIRIAGFGAKGVVHTTMNHEVIHVITAKNIDDYYNNPSVLPPNVLSAIQDMDTIRLFAISKLIADQKTGAFPVGASFTAVASMPESTPSERLAKQKAVSANLRMLAAARRAPNLTQAQADAAYRAHYLERAAYGLSSLYEFPSEALSIEFQRLLNGISADGLGKLNSSGASKGSLWDRVKSAFRQMLFGGRPLDPTSLLAKTIDSTIDLLSASGTQTNIRVARGTALEVAPDPANVPATTEWSQLTQSQRAAITQEVGEPQLTKLAIDMGLPEPDFSYTIGGFEKTINPSISTQFPDTVSYDKVKEYLTAAGVMLRQNSVIAYDEDVTEGDSLGYFIRMTPSRALDTAEIESFYNALRIASDRLVDGFTSRDGSIIVGNFTDTSNEEFYKKVEQAAATVVQGSNYDLATESYKFRSDFIPTADEALDQTQYGKNTTTDRSTEGEETIRGREGRFRAIQAETDALYRDALNRIQTEGARTKSVPTDEVLIAAAERFQSAASVAAPSEGQASKTKSNKPSPRLIPNDKYGDPDTKSPATDTRGNLGSAYGVLQRGDDGRGDGRPSLTERFRRSLSGKDLAAFAQGGQNERRRVGVADIRSLERWADKNNLILNADLFRRTVLKESAQRKEIGSGSEHTVYRDAATKRVIKLTHADDFGNGAIGQSLNAFDYLTGLMLQNETFGDDIRFEGIVYLDGVLPQIVISQPFVKGRKSTIAEINAYFTGLGFARNDNGQWVRTRDGVTLAALDTVPDNIFTAVRRGKRIVVPFDVQMFADSPLVITEAASEESVADKPTRTNEELNEYNTKQIVQWKKWAQDELADLNDQLVLANYAVRYAAAFARPLPAAPVQRADLTDPLADPKSKLDATWEKSIAAMKSDGILVVDCP